jgi:hypothetical protein
VELATIASELAKFGHVVSKDTVARYTLLVALPQPSASHEAIEKKLREKLGLLDAQKSIELWSYRAEIHPRWNATSRSILRSSPPSSSTSRRMLTPHATRSLGTSRRCARR